MITIRKPNDFHHHLREKELLVLTVKNCFDKFHYVTVMPNLQKPIISLNTSFNREILSKNACYFKSDNELYNILKNDQHHKINKPLFKKEYTANYTNTAYFELINHS